MGCRSVLERTPSRTALHRARARLAWELTRTDGPAESFAWRTWTAHETVTAHEPHTFGSQGATVARRAQGRGERGKESEAHWQSFDILWFTSSSTMYTMFIRVRVPQPTRPQTSRYPWMEVPEMHAHVRECVVIRNDNRATHTHTHRTCLASAVAASAPVRSLPHARPADQQPTGRARARARPQATARHTGGSRQVPGVRGGTTFMDGSPPRSGLRGRAPAPARPEGERRKTFIQFSRQFWFCVYRFAFWFPVCTCV